VQNSSLDNLQTAANVLGYAINSKKAEAQANAQALAHSSAIVQAIEAKDHKNLAGLATSTLQTKQQSGLVITTSSAQVLLRGDNPDKWGDSLSSDPLLRRALVGETSSSIVSNDGVLGPVISIKSAVPVRDGNNIIGAVISAALADNAFVDGIKNSTGLESSIYGGNVLSATTLVAPDNKTRQIGVKLNDNQVTGSVLKNGRPFKGTINLFNRQFLAVYDPLKDINNNVVGMLFVGQPSSSVLQTAGHSIELTFLVASALIIFSIIPAYVVSRHLAKQI
jgi:methyl-accepting chemotaxis protein